MPAELAEGVAVQPDGKIVLAGHEQGSNTYAYIQGIVVRLSSNGSLDPSFHGSGVVSFLRPGGGSGSDTLNAVTLQNDGRIVVAGADINSGGPTAFFLRLSSDGSFDAGFGSGGAAFLSAGTFTTQPAGAYGVGIAGGGRIVGAGAVQLNGTDYRAGLFALTPSGAAQTDFGGGGIVEQQSGDEACALAVAPDGSLVIAGGSVSATGNPSGPCTVPSGFSPRRVRGSVHGIRTAAQRTLAGPSTGLPSAGTGAATAITELSATVSGQVGPNGLATTYHVDYGTSSSYRASTSATSVPVASSSQSVAARLTGLRPGTTYHYRLVATNPDGTAYGADTTFKTGPRLSVTMRRVSRSYSVAQLARSGLTLALTCNQPCSLRASLVISRGTAERLRLGRRLVRIGAGSASLERAGTARVIVRLTKAVIAKLRHARGIRATLRVAVAPVGGGSRITLTKAITLKR